MGVVGVVNFGGLEGKDYETKETRFSVLPVPYDLTATYATGARGGPRALLEASTHMELYDEELHCEPWRAGIETLALLEEATTLEPPEMVKRVQAATARILKRGRVPVVIGGEHSITIGVVGAVKESYPELSVLQLDAHADLRDTYPFNHACVARRISELCPLVQVGVRSLSAEEAEFLKKEKPEIKTYYAADFINGRCSNEIVEDLSEEVFITIDLDVFDPSVMPATGTPEPGGLGWYEVLGLLRSVSLRRKVMGFDVVELCPIPGCVAPDFLAARLSYKLMGYINEGIEARKQKKAKKAKKVK
jgi:agmatinase